jgi:hypothetical protein
VSGAMSGMNPGAVADFLLVPAALAAHLKG